MRLSPARLRRANRLSLFVRFVCPVNDINLLLNQKKEDTLSSLVLIKNELFVPEGLVTSSLLHESPCCSVLANS